MGRKKQSESDWLGEAGIWLIRVLGSVALVLAMVWIVATVAGWAADRFAPEG